MFSRLIMMSVQPPQSVVMSQYVWNGALPPAPSGSIKYTPSPVDHAYALGAGTLKYHWQDVAYVPSHQLLPVPSSPVIPMVEHEFPEYPEAQEYVQFPGTAEYVHSCPTELGDPTLVAPRFAKVGTVAQNPGTTPLFNPSTSAPVADGDTKSLTSHETDPERFAG
ncbi:MAG: hypothetical protein WA194_09545 [Patescibacteria group bacterium]